MKNKFPSTDNLELGEAEFAKRMYNTCMEQYKEGGADALVGLVHAVNDIQNDDSIEEDNPMLLGMLKARAEMMHDLFGFPINAALGGILST